MADHDPRYQVAYNGLLQPDFRARLDVLRRDRKLTLSQFGEKLGVSGAFIGNLINGKKAIRTKHVAGIVRVIEEMEGKSGTALPTVSPPQEGKLLDESSLEDLARRANALGFNVSFTQIA